jgi:hypothetical protein
MTKKSPITVLLLSCVTCGIYQIIWMVSAKGEMTAKGADIPTSWFLIIPVLNLIYLWKWCQGVEHVTKGQMTAVTALILNLFLGPIAAMMIQGKFNEVN